MARVLTQLTRLLDTKVPVICAPMANVGAAKLAVEATLGGAFGFMGAGYWPAQKVKEELAYATEALNSAGRVRPDGKIPVGIAFFGYKLDQNEKAASEVLDLALAAKVQAIWLSFGDNLGRWVEYVRTKDSSTPRTLLFILANTVEEGLAAKQLGADVIVAQGIESGGHGSSHAPSVFSLVSSLVPQLADGPPLLAAGGIAHGGQVAAFLTLGAAGAVLGTRFLLTPESLYSDTQKAALLRARAADTVRTTAFDEARATLGWPAGVDGRGLRNALVADFAAGADVAALRARFADNARAGGDPAYAVIWAGTGVGEMREIKGAQDIVRQLHREIIDRLSATQQLLDGPQTRL
ncbi:nitronate monooxygenase [Phanerochaete sordida]|uniref:Nitronate monooxygenase n=1 Tax=Phanerochaete sordida TaxID=48140 RepID=A0A9P3GAK8_9APHY|nr:nitronate monooxygenase [Phanerochaete sordida]